MSNSLPQNVELLIAFQGINIEYLVIPVKVKESLYMCVLIVLMYLISKLDSIIKCNV